MIEIRYVCEQDRDFWFKLDSHIKESEFLNKIERQMGYVITENGIPVGLLRYNLFWDNTPFCNLLFVDWDSQGRGYGKDLMTHWEKDMRLQGYDMVMTSTQVDENAQHFYRKIGYQDVGGLIINLPGHEQPMEMFLIKGI